MPIIIDGWNLVRNEKSGIDDGELEGLETARRLIVYLEEFQRGRGDPVIVVFDSKREHLALDYAPGRQLTIVPSANADEYIKRYIDRTPERQRRNIRVVSSDKSVYYYAKSSCATPVRSEEFWLKLRRGRKVRQIP